MEKKANLEKLINNIRREFKQENFFLYAPEDYKIAERKYVKYILSNFDKYIFNYFKEADKWQNHTMEK